MSLISRVLPSHGGFKFDIACTRAGVGAVNLHVAVLILTREDGARGGGGRGVQRFAARRDLSHRGIGYPYED